jgi:hypothetical protein
MISESPDLLPAYDWPQAEPFLARLADGRWVMTDYVNDPVDFRILTHAREGVPGEVAERIAEVVTRSFVQAA